MSKSGKVFDVAVPSIILVCSFLYYFANTSSRAVLIMQNHFAVSRVSTQEFRLWTFLSHPFYHHEFLHLFITVLGLITFGFMLENMIGSKWFIEYFMACSAIGAMNHFMISPAIGRPDDMLYGATGPITGIIVLCAMIYRNRVLWVLKFIPVKPMWLALPLVMVDLAGLIVGGELGEAPIGHGNHIACAFVGIVYYHKVLRHRVWRNLVAAGEGKELQHVRVTKAGWIIPSRDTEEFEDMTVFLRDVLGMEITDQGAPVVDTSIVRFAKFRTPTGSINLVEPNRLTHGGLFIHPIVSLTVDNLAAAVKNLDSRKVKMVAPVYHSAENFAIVYFKGPDDRIYEIKGPYPNQ